MLDELKTFNCIVGRIDGAYHDAAARFGISDSVFEILYVLCEQGEGCRQSALYKNSGRGKTTINSAIRKMEREGLLYLLPDEGRNTRVFLTEKGRALSRDTAERIIAVENEIFRSWTAEERQLFLALNQRYLDAFLARTSTLPPAQNAAERRALPGGEPPIKYESEDPA